MNSDCCNPCFDCPGEERDKRPAVRHGHLEATCDPQVISFWWWQNRLIGTPTGAISKTLVVDVDPRNGGGDWLKEHRHELPETRIHGTRNHGQHWVYQHPGFAVSGSQGVIAPGVDIRCDGNYIIYWPASGIPVISDALLAPLPGWLLRILWERSLQRSEREALARLPAQRTPDRYSIEHILTYVGRSVEGERNAKLYWAARKLSEMVTPGVFDADQALALLIEAAGMAGTPASEARATARSGLNARGKAP